MHFSATTFATTSLLLLAHSSSFCQAQRRLHHGRRLGPGGSKDKTTFTGFTATSDVQWKTDATCVDYNSVSLTASDTTSKVGANGKPEKTTYESVDFYMTLVSQCATNKAVYTYISLGFYGLEDAADATVTVDAKLNSGTVSSTGEAWIYTESCTLKYDSTDAYYYYDPCGCTKVSDVYEVITMETQLMGVGKALPSKFSQSYRSPDFGYDFRYTGTTRDAELVSMKVTRKDGRVINVLASDTISSYDYNSLGKAKGGETYYF